MRKATGIVRKIDQLGRIVIPKELLNTLAIGPKDAMEIFTDGDSVILKAYTPGCAITGEISDDLIAYNGKFVSRTAIEEMAKIAKATQPPLRNNEVNDRPAVFSNGGRGA